MKKLSIKSSINVTVILLILFISPVFSQSQIHFAVIGDFGKAGSDELAVSELVKSWNPDFIVTVGDNNYESGSASTIDENIGQYYHEFIFPYVGTYGKGANKNKFFPSPGNHDWRADSLTPYRDYFELPNNERYYDFIVGNVHFFMLDSDGDEPDGNSSSSIQANWFYNKISTSSSTWKIVCLHHPPYSSGRHGSNSNMQQWDFPQTGATTVIAGHDHTYERIEKDGFTYFVNGLGGKSLYNWGSIVSGSQMRYNDNYGAMLVDAYTDSIVFKFIDINNDTIDSYSIINPPTINGFTYFATYNGNLYYFSNANQFWQDSKQLCIDNGGHLVTFTDIDENNYINTELRNVIGRNAIWFGLTDENVEGQFEWVTGDSLTFANWQPGEPNNQGGNQHYGLMGSNGQWDDTFNSNSARCVLEIEILPVELISFTATLHGNATTLNWTTVTEQNNSGFEVQRSKFESVWEKITFIGGNGTTTQSYNYSYVDNNLTAGKYLYRLKQIDFDGGFKYSNEIEVEVNVPLTFGLEQNYPNPFNPTTRIQYQIPEVGTRHAVSIQLKVYDILGNEIATLVNKEQIPGYYEVQFNGSNFPSGVYFYNLQASEFVVTKKMILVK
ncbi:MAG: lectin-like protein [Ignavibacteriaceae bacterium]